MQSDNSTYRPQYSNVNPTCIFYVVLWFQSQPTLRHVWATDCNGCGNVKVQELFHDNAVGIPECQGVLFNREHVILIAI